MEVQRTKIQQETHTYSSGTKNMLSYCVIPTPFYHFYLNFRWWAIFIYLTDVCDCDTCASVCVSLSRVVNFSQHIWNNTLKYNKTHTHKYWNNKDISTRKNGLYKARLKCSGFIYHMTICYGLYTYQLEVLDDLNHLAQQICRHF